MLFAFSFFFLSCPQAKPNFIWDADYNRGFGVGETFISKLQQFSCYFVRKNFN